METKTDKTVAIEILKQLGGNRFVAMVGANNLVCSNNMMAFKFMRNPSKANYCRITLNAWDTYKMEFIRIHGNKIETMHEFDNIYNDMLVKTFEETTGLYTKL